MLSLALALGLMLSATPGTGATVLAAEEPGSEVAVVVQEQTEADKTELQTENAETEDASGTEVPEPEEGSEPSDVGTAEDAGDTAEKKADASDAAESEETTSEDRPEADTAEAADASADAAAADPATEQEPEDIFGASGMLRFSSAAVGTVDDEPSDGWTQTKDGWYYYEDGGAVTGWKEIKKKFYYFNSSGLMVTGWKNLDGATYYFFESGTNEGVMASGWKKIGGYWYFFPSGKMTTGWKTISGEKYYFNSNGQMQTEQWIGDLWLRDDGTATDEVFSREYMGTDYYTKLQQTLKEVQDEPDIMKRVLKIAQSQEGYNNYSVAGLNVEDVRANGNLWTGAVKRSAGNGTGNTEYTRWAQRYVMRRNTSEQYSDMQWCAIFSSWCLYQAGLYYGQEHKSWYYSYCADPRVERYAINSSFNCDQAQVWYTPLATEKIAKYAGWNTYVHTEVEPYDIPYRPGGLIFFDWDGDGAYFQHVGIVVNYDEDRHVLRYISGNCSGQVKTYDVYYDKSTGDGFNYEQTIMAYAEYYEGREAWKAEDGRIRYYRNGKYLTGWQEIDGRTYYFDSDGDRRLGFVKVDGYWYYMNSAGVLVKGWKEVDGDLYYFNEKGIMVTGKQELNGRTYYFAPAGFLYKNGWWKGYQYDANANLVSNTKVAWHKAKMGWWYGNSTWYAKDTTIRIDGVEYSFDRSGYMIDPSRKLGWVKDNGELFYYPEENKMAIGWKKIDGDWYYFGKEGWMRKNGWWQGWYIREDGICTATVKAVWKKNRIGWWFGDTTGWYAKGEVLRISDRLYEFDDMGYLIED